MAKKFRPPVSTAPLMDKAEIRRILEMVDADPEVIAAEANPTPGESTMAVFGIMASSMLDMAKGKPEAFCAEKTQRLIGARCPENAGTLTPLESELSFRSMDDSETQEWLTARLAARLAQAKAACPGEFDGTGRGAA